MFFFKTSKHKWTRFPLKMVHWWILAGPYCIERNPVFHFHIESIVAAYPQYLYHQFLFISSLAWPIPVCLPPKWKPRVPFWRKRLIFCVCRFGRNIPEVVTASRSSFCRPRVLHSRGRWVLFSLLSSGTHHPPIGLGIFCMTTFTFKVNKYF